MAMRQASAAFAGIRTMPKIASGRAERGKIVIAGGGLVGLACALALKHQLGARSIISVCDPRVEQPTASAAAADHGAHRASAVAAASRRLLQRLGVWPDIADVAQPISDMVITDSRVGDAVRPAFLTFAHDGEAGEPFAHMVPDAALYAALYKRAIDQEIILESVAVKRTELVDGRVCVFLANGTQILADLVIAADGARSRLREAAGLGWISWAYPQAGIVAAIRHARPHLGRAYEHFLPSGPFAILPLTDARAADAGDGLKHRSSIVWTEKKSEIDTFLALPKDDLLTEISRRFGFERGEIALDSEVRAYPLAFGLARRFVSERLALVGEAAHVIHPIAGQGLNLGLKDVATLADCIANTVRLGLDAGDVSGLSTYETARRSEIVAMAAATDGLNRLFSNDVTPLRLARDLGLGLVDRMPGLKRLFMNEAAGFSGDVPALMRPFDREAVRGI
jgi:2-octaprenyl-6-methoxyphenol hydroxylase